MLWGKGTGQAEVTFTSKLGSKLRQEGLAALALAYWLVSWDDCQVKPGREWHQPLWNPRLIGQISQIARDLSAQAVKSEYNLFLCF